MLGGIWRPGAEAGYRWIWVYFRILATWKGPATPQPILRRGEEPRAETPGHDVCSAVKRPEDGSFCTTEAEARSPEPVAAGGVGANQGG